MALAVTHTFTSSVPDDAASSAAGEVTPTRWNGTAAHTLTGTADLTQIDQSIAPTWTGVHVWTTPANVTGLTVTGGTQTTNTTANPTISITRTNAVGAGNSAPALLFANITNTSGSAANKIFDFQVGGVTQLNLQVGGTLVGANDFLCAGTLQCGAGQKFQWNGRAFFTSASTASVETAAFPLVGNATSIPAGGTVGSGYKFSSTSNFGVFFGSGAPSLSAAKGSLYLRSDGSTTNDRMYVNTDGGTGWTAVTTAT